MKLLAQALFFLVLTGCATTKPQIYPSTVRGADYNSIAERYTVMPTTAEVDTGLGGVQYLIYRVDLYSFSGGSQNIFMLNISKENGMSIIALIDKYLKWEEIALRDGDQLDKEIGTAKEVLGGNEYKFSFHSGNKKDHFLSVSMCMTFTCTSTGYFDKANAALLKNEISQFLTGKYKVVDNSKYD
jgi:hypothetical protein